MSTDFKYTGHPQPARTASLSGSGIAITGPGLGKYITIFDILASESTLLRANNGGGEVIAYVPSGATNLTASITGGISNDTGNSIMSTVGNVTITYSIQVADWLP
tara:strand:+ start:661 stop:975 length:315 start_codon:yes stop_codon:yes gene_type:complete